ncbi:MAG TPA: hypothetical protein PKH19_01740 [Candidatus Syntrophosphaera sp.]|nr:hypothetical protein [Candidatus Syntrophosphaera sp.]
MKTCYKHSTALLVLVALLLVLGGCLKGKNPTGNNWTNVYPLTFTDSTSCVAGFSFAGSGTVKGTETRLLSGDYEGQQAMMVARFTGLPQDLSIPPGYQDSTYLELTLLRRSPVSRYPVELSVYKLNQAWAADSTSLIQDGNLTLLTPQPYTIPDSISTAGTEIRIPLPLDALAVWQSTADSLGLSLAIKTGDESFVEISAAETGRGPRLRFLYRTGDLEVEDDDLEYNQRATRDSYRLDSDEAPLLSNRWVVSNINPSRLYVNFALDASLFRHTPENGGGILTDLQRKRATINYAALILHVKDNPYYGGTTQYSLRGDRVRDSLDLSVPVEITDSQVANGLISQAVVSGDSVVVNITPLVQAWSSGDSGNWGMVVRSLQELLNFGRLEFWHFTDAPPDKQPKLRVTYTPPIL